MRQAEYEFAECVAEIHKNQQKNELVEWTKNYIYQNLHSDIVIGEIGQKIGVNTSYLSDLFHKVEGTTIQQYIRKEKIRLAENMLRYSDYEVKEIANYLSFCSQSYFGNIFRQQTGMTPARYRKKYGKWKEQQGTGDTSDCFWKCYHYFFAGTFTKEFFYIRPQKLLEDDFYSTCTY